jgi:hypothetical protein
MKKNRIAQLSLIVVSMMLLSLLGSGTTIAGDPDGDPGSVAESSAEGQGAVLLSPDIVHADDVIIDGSLCVGNDCYSGLAFGFDTIVLMENNLRFIPQAGPAWEWRLTHVGTDGDESLAAVDTGQVSPILTAPDAVAFPRGGLTEQYLARVDSLEQQFLISPAVGPAGR